MSIQAKTIKTLAIAMTLPFLLAGCFSDEPTESDLFALLKESFEGAQNAGAFMLVKTELVSVKKVGCRWEDERKQWLCDIDVVTRVKGKETAPFGGLMEVERRKDGTWVMRKLSK